MGGDLVCDNDICSNGISIHTTRVGGDGLSGKAQNIVTISIHTTRVGGDPTI